jgi:hypothetical protein
MFEWPQTIEGRGVITVTGRHQTPGLRVFGCGLTMLVGWAMVIHTFFGTYSPANAWALSAGRYLIAREYWAWAAIGYFGGQFFLGAYLADEGQKRRINLFGWLFRARTTVRINAQAVQVVGIPYGRDAAPIQFTNLYPHVVQAGGGDGRHTMLGSLEETASLRMFYGFNAVVVTTFTSVRDASRFALACNSAMGLVVPLGPAFEVIPIAEIYRGGPVADVRPGKPPPMLPRPGEVRRRQR